MDELGGARRGMEPTPMSIPELDVEGLRRAAEAHFPANKGLPLPSLLALADEFYSTLDLDERGDIWANVDPDLLERAVTLAADYVEGGATMFAPPTRRLLVIGCGSGRLVDVYLRLAVRCRFREIVFNDLRKSLVEATRDRIDSLGGPPRDVRVHYHAGDFAQFDMAKSFDLAVAWFFVGNELVALESVEALRSRRAAYFAAVRRSLHPNGVFIEDVAEATLPGFYATLRKLTAQVLAERNVMEREREHLSLTNIPKQAGGMPYHIRFTPDATRRMQEIHANGFRCISGGWTTSAPPTRGGNAVHERWKRVDLFAAR